MVDNVLFGWFFGGFVFCFGLVLLMQELILQIFVHGTPPFRILRASPKPPGFLGSFLPCRGRYFVLTTCNMFIWPDRVEPGTRRPTEIK